MCQRRSNQSSIYSENCHARSAMRHIHTEWFVDVAQKQHTAGRALIAKKSSSISGSTASGHISCGLVGNALWQQTDSRKRDTKARLHWKVVAAVLLRERTRPGWHHR